MRTNARPRFGRALCVSLLQACPMMVRDYALSAPKHNCLLTPPTRRARPAACACCLLTRQGDVRLIDHEL